MALVQPSVSGLSMPPDIMHAGKKNGEGHKL